MCYGCNSIAVFICNDLLPISCKHVEDDTQTGVDPLVDRMPLVLKRQWAMALQQ